MIVKLLKQTGQAAVVTYRDDVTGILNAKVISIKDLPVGLRKGQEVTISKDALVTGTDYGIDWGIILDRTDMTQLVVKQLRECGVWTIEDLSKRPEDAMGAIRAAALLMYSVMVSTEI